MKNCSKCGQTKPLSEFGKHKTGKDGVRSRCKTCEVAVNTAYRKTEHGAAALSAYRATETAKASAKAALQRWVSSDSGKATKRKIEARYPKRRAARNALTEAVRTGRVIPWPVCELPDCNDKPEAHHPDYDRPLQVVWLCHAHHKQAHALVLEEAA